jgi:multicomponent Na+:H+ antiporter subunit D
MILGALLIPWLRGRALQGWMLTLPLLSAWHLLSFDLGHTTTLTLMDRQLTPIRIDRLSLVWGYVFHIASFLGAMFALGVRDKLQHVCAFAYAGAAIAAVFAGDLVTLFVFWELTAVTSVGLVWATRTRRAYVSGLRYLVIQVLSGVLLLAGSIFRAGEGYDLTFGHIGWTGELGAALIFGAFAVKAAFPLLHNWLQDAYPNATPTGTVFLSSFTTKLAIYALARSFAGTEFLIYLGAAMTLFPIFYAVIENDLRRVLAYSLNNQLGYMVVGVGIGTELALNGTASHAFAHIIYKSLLFMAMGAVLMRTGTAKGSELGGLYKTMPWTTLFCIIGAAAISGFPLFSGFVSKSMIVSAAGEHHAAVVYLALLFASAGVFHHSGIKIPYFAFFAHDSGKRPAEAPTHMLVAMGLASVLCVLLGVMPSLLYDVLPYPVDYVPYTWDHVVSQMQLLLGSAMAFGILNRIGAYPPELRSTVLDTDWLYRRGLPWGVRRSAVMVASMRAAVLGPVRGLSEGALTWVSREAKPSGSMSRPLTTGRAALSVALVLSAYALLYFRLAESVDGHGAASDHHESASEPHAH